MFFSRSTNRGPSLNKHWVRCWDCSGVFPGHSCLVVAHLPTCLCRPGVPQPLGDSGLWIWYTAWSWRKGPWMKAQTQNLSSEGHAQSRQGHSRTACQNLWNLGRGKLG